MRLAKSIVLIVRWRFTFWLRFIRGQTEFERRSRPSALLFVAVVAAAFAWVSAIGLSYLARALYDLGNPGDSLAVLCLGGLLFTSVIVQSLIQGIPKERRVPLLLWLSPLPRWLAALSSILATLVLTGFLVGPLLLTAIAVYPSPVYAYWIYLVPFWLSLALRNRLKWLQVPVASTLSLGTSYLAMRTCAELARHNLLFTVGSAEGETLAESLRSSMIASMHAAIERAAPVLAPFRSILLAPWPVHAALFCLFGSLIVWAAGNAYAETPAAHRTWRLPRWLPPEHRLALSEPRRTDFLGLMNGAGFVGFSLALWRGGVLSIEAAYFLAIWRFFLAFWGTSWRHGLPFERGLLALMPDPQAFARRIWRGRVEVLLVSVAVFLIPGPRMLLWSVPGVLYSLALVRYGPRKYTRMVWWQRLGLNAFMIVGVVILSLHRG